MLAGMWRKSRSKSWVWLSSPLTLFSTKSPHSLGFLSWRKKIQLLTYFLLILLWPSASPSFLQVVLAQFLLPASIRMPTHLLSTSLSCLNCPLLHITSWFGHWPDLTSLNWSRRLILHPLGNKLACLLEISFRDLDDRLPCIVLPSLRLKYLVTVLFQL